MRLPFRRGYHGPPGNGKTSVIRAILTSEGLSAYTLRLFDSQTDDEDMERLFE
jgi:replication-associated recombination protein RarA